MKLIELMPSIRSLIDYDYEEMKSPLYEEIIYGFLCMGDMCEVPTFIQVSGGPGAGKSTFCRNRKYNRGLFISFDAVMFKIPQYNEDVKNLGLDEAFKKWEMPARVIGYEILRRAVIDRFDIVFDHSGVNAAHMELFENLRKIGYKTRVDFIICDKKVALKRAERRAKKINRITPKAHIEERHALAPEYLEKYKAAADEVNVYDTSKDFYDLKDTFTRKCES